MLFLDVAILVCALMVIVLIVVKMMAAHHLAEVRAQWAQLAREQSYVARTLDQAQKRRASARGTRAFMQRRKAECLTNIADMIQALATRQADD